MTNKKAKVNHSTFLAIRPMTASISAAFNPKPIRYEFARLGGYYYEDRYVTTKDQVIDWQRQANTSGHPVPIIIERDSANRGYPWSTIIVSCTPKIRQENYILLPNIEYNDTINIEGTHGSKFKAFTTVFGYNVLVQLRTADMYKIMAKGALIRTNITEPFKFKKVYNGAIAKFPNL